MKSTIRAINYLCHYQAGKVALHSFFSTLNRARLDWNEENVINKHYITELKLNITNNFPANFSDGYPAADLKILYEYEYGKKLNLSKNYNPLSLPLAETLTSCGKFYRGRTIADDERSYSNTYKISKKDAFDGYLNFLKEYSLAYIDYLEAINGSAKALESLKLKFTTEEMVTVAAVQMKYFNKQYFSTTDFLYGILAHLSMHIVFAKENDIPTIARARAFEILVNHFDIEKIAKAFRSHAGNEYDLCRMFGDKNDVYNLIPKEFVTESHETGQQPHNKLFFKNKTIAKIFQINANFPNPEEENLHLAISNIITHYQVHAIHIIHSALRVMHYMSDSFQYLFCALVKLSKLDNIQKEAIFGDNASYRNGGENIHNATAQIDWVMGLANFGGYLDENDLNQLDVEQLKIRIRQQAYRIYQLEAAALNAEKEHILNSLNNFNDPAGYYKRLLMPPEGMPEAEFMERLVRNYRVLAHQYHPDANSASASTAEFQAIQEAYEVLRDRTRRMNYLIKTGSDILNQQRVPDNKMQMS